MAKRLKETIQKVDLSLLDEPKGIVRMEINDDYISELAQSISEIGLLQPVLIRPDGDRYEVVFGHRRYLACKRAGLSTINAIVRKMTDEEAAVARAAENLDRIDLTPIEEAATYRDLIDTHGMSVEKVAEKIGRTPGTIKRRLDLLKMPPLLQKAVHLKMVSMTVAEELWPISDLTDLEYYLTFAIENGATKEVARSWCKAWKDSKRREGNPGEGGGGVASPYEPRPVYVACDVCLGSVELGQDQLLRICGECHGKIRSVI